MSPKYFLNIRDDQGRETQVQLKRDLVTVGREAGNLIRLPEQNVSREHARFIKATNAVFVEDLSRYGTRVNGERFSKRRELVAGDVVQIGDYVVEFKIAGKKAKEPAPEVLPVAKKSRAGDTALVNVSELQERERARARKRFEASVPILVGLSPPVAGGDFHLNGDELVIGRTQDNGVAIDHDSISRHHARLTRSGDQWAIRDLDSANGLRVNGEYFTDSTLRNGDIIELGQVSLRFVAAGETFVYEPPEQDEALGATKQSSNKGMLAFVLLLLVAGGVTAGLALSGGGDAGILADPDTQASSLDNGQTAAAGTNTQDAKTLSATTKDIITNTKKTDVPAVIADTTTGTVKVDAGTSALSPKDAGPEKAPEDVPQIKATVDVKAPSGETDVSAPKAPDVKQVQEDPSIALMNQAQTHVANKRWKEAIDAFDAVLELDSDHDKAKSGLLNARNEIATKKQLDDATLLVSKKKLKQAWAQLRTLSDVSKQSTYYAALEDLRSTVQAAYRDELIKRTRSELTRKRYKQALQQATAALKVDPSSSTARTLKARAKSKLTTSENKPEPKTKEPKAKEPKAKEPKADGKMSGRDLYKAARAVHNSSPSQAEKLYKQSAAKGYAKAWRQLGTLYLKTGARSKAISAYKKYLRLRPGASDAESIRNTVQRLGGSL